METKSKQQIEAEVSAYLDKTSKHLFVTESGYFYKILSFTKNDKKYYATIMLHKSQVQINVQEIVTDNQYKWYGNNTVNIIKHSLFPDYYKTKSIPFFKKMKGLMKEIEVEISIDNTKNKDLMEKIKGQISDLEVLI